MISNAVNRVRPLGTLLGTKNLGTAGVLGCKELGESQTCPRV